MKVFIISMLIAVGLFSTGARADCTNPAGPEGVLGYFSADKTYKFCDGTDWVWMRPPTSLPQPNYDSGWQTTAAPNTTVTLTHNLGTKEFKNVVVLGSCGSDDTVPIFVGGVSSSGTGAYGNDVQFDTANTIKVGTYLHGGMSGSQCGAAAKFRVKLWK